MERLDLKAQARTETGKGACHRLRRNGFIPAVLYGPKTEAIPLAVDAVEFEKTFGGEGKENVLINLSVEGLGFSNPKVAMIRDIQIDPLKRNMIHADFYEINLEEQVEVAIPVLMVGKAEGIKAGGILEQIEREIEVRCLPTQIPEHIEIDVTNLGVGEAIHVRDISVPEGLEILTPGEQTVLRIVSGAAEADRAERRATEAATAAEAAAETAESEEK